MRQPYWRCPKCNRESLELESTGLAIYRENVEEYRGRWVVCDSGCNGHWLIPGRPNAIKQAEKTS